MYIVDMYLRVRRACLVEGMSIREASRVFGLHRDTVRKMLSHPVPPGYRRKRPPHRPKLEPYTNTPITSWTYLRVRRACLVEGMSIREASRVFGLHHTVRKMLSHPCHSEYRRNIAPNGRHRPHTRR